MQQIKTFLVLTLLEGIGAFIWAALTPSESGSAVLFGFSLARLVLLAAILFFCLVSVIATAWLWRSPKLLIGGLNLLDSWCLQQKKLVPTLVVLVTTTVLVLAGIRMVVTTPLDFAVYGLWAPLTFPLLYTLVTRLLPLIAWGLAWALLCSLLLVSRYAKALTQPAMWSWQQIERYLLVMLILAVTFSHWIILAFQLRFFTNHPAWYWSISANPFTIRDLLLTAVSLPVLGLIYWTLAGRRWVRTGLLLVFTAGCLLQLSIGYLEGDGIVSLRHRYFSRYHSSYANHASENTRPILENIRDYEQTYLQGRFTSTKPPGLMTFYIAIDQLTNGNPSPFSSAMRLERLSWVITYSFPVVAMLMVFVLYAFASKYLQDQTGLAARIAPLLWILCPNILLLSLYPDQAIYPLMFLISAGLAVEIVQRQSLAAAFLYGAFLYLAVFFAFTMLPLYPLVAIFLALNYWLQRKQLSLNRQVAMGFMMAAGTILLYVAFRGLLNYDFFPRFAKSVAINHNFDFYLRVGLQLPDGPVPLLTRLQQISGAAWINNLEYASTIGFPIFLLFIIQSMRLINRLVRQTHLPGDAVLGAFLSTFVVLNLAGTAQGEVGRLWIFWVPMVILFASIELEKLLRKNSIALLGLLVLQYGSVLLTYHFQDLTM